MNNSKNTFEHIDAWAKSEETFRQQLTLNLTELSKARYPPHWLSFLNFIDMIEHYITTVVDIGCGCGSLYKMCQDQKLGLDYIGFDYSSPAINIATAQWGNHFFKKSYQQLISTDIPPKSVVVANALADVLPNGDECVEHLLNVTPKCLILLRIKITEKDSFFETYDAYNITTYAFCHNWENLRKMFNKYNYVYHIEAQQPDMYNILLEKNHS